jgi:hypothetical protein
MKKLFIVGLMVLSLVFGGQAFACDGPDCNAEGNFDIDTFAIGGGLSTDGVWGNNAGAGGIGVAGGIAGSKASGHVESYEKPIYDWVKVQGKYCSYWKYMKVGSRTVMLGHAEGALHSSAGGATLTESYDFYTEDDPRYDKKYGVMSYTDNIDVRATSWLNLNAFGLAGADAMFGGIAGQGSANGAFIGPHPDQNIKGGAIAGTAQGSLVGYYGLAGTGLIGDVEIDTGAVMFGFSEAGAYRAVDYFEGGMTQTFVGWTRANTDVYSAWNYQNSDGLAASYVNGGWVAGGAGYTASVMATEGGMAKATAAGTYSGHGELGCDFNGMLDGYSKTQSTTYDGYNGTVMRSSAGMTVNIGSEQPK